MNYPEKRVTRAVTTMESLCGVLLACVVVVSVSHSAHAARAVSVSLTEFVTEMRVFMPAEASGGYVVPTVEERASFAAAAKALAAGDVARAELAIAPYPDFEVLDLEDRDSGAKYFTLSEKPPIGRGWGYYFFARSARRPMLIIEAPHPLADRDSELAAARATSELSPVAFLLAGAHRYANPGIASDVSHVASSIFEAVHEVALSADCAAIQVHGFSAAGHRGYPQLVISSGAVPPGQDAAALCGAITTRGMDCVTFDGTAWSDLGALANVQGGFARRTFGSGHFLHIETDESVRDDEARVRVVVDAIGAHWPAIATGCGCEAAASPPAALSCGFLVLACLRRRSLFTPRP